MKRLLRLLVAPLSLFLFSFPIAAQVTFVSPPTYYGSGSNIFTADFNGDSKPDLLTGDGTLSLGNGDGTFTLGTPISGTPLAVADFNGDGKPDILELGTGTLIVLLGNGDGTFQTPISTPSGAGLTAVAAGNLNGDGKADVVGVFNNSLYVYLSNGDGTFTAGNFYSLGTTIVSPVLTLADFTGDGDVDVVVNDGQSTNMAVLLGNGNGTFQTAKISSAASTSYVAVGDFNGDGKLDLALDGAVTSASSEVYLLLGNGDGTFQSPTSVFSGGNGWGIAAADVNGDGDLDLVILAEQTISQVYLGSGNGTFSNASNYMDGVFLNPTGTLNVGQRGVVTADFNGDGKPDFATENTVFLGNGDGTFQGVPLDITQFEPGVLGAFANNGPLDVASVGSADTYIYSNNGTGILSLSNTYPSQVEGYLFTSDFNGDGDLDLISLAPSSQNNYSYEIFFGNGNGTFQAGVVYSLNVSDAEGEDSACGQPVFADFNNDHKLDLAIPTCNQMVAIFLGNGDGSFSGPTYFYDAAANPDTTLLAADFNLDGNIDLAISSLDGSVPTFILYGNGNGTFQAGVFPPSLDNFFSLFTADFNNDGKPDLVSNSLVALGNGDGTFTVLPQTVAFPQGVADFNGDGILDLWVATSSNGSPTYSAVQLGNGDGTFAPPTPAINGFTISELYGYGVELKSPLLGDMNGDGLTDVVFYWNDVVNPNHDFNGGIGVLLNTTKASTPQPAFKVVASGFSPTPVVAGNSATATVTVSPLNGFNGTVALSCASSIPSGTNCSFNPATIANGSGTSTLTLATSSSVSPGSYTIVVNGVSGSVTYVGATTLTVNSGSAPDFQISATSASPSTVAAGSSATSTVSIASLNGFDSAVALTCGSGNSAVTCSLNPSSVTPSGSASVTSTLTIDATTAAADGTYSITVSGSSASSQHDAFVTVIVGSAPDFTLGTASGSPSSQTVSPGQNADFSLSLAPSGSFTGTVNLSCAITPTTSQAPTCNLSSSSIQLSGTSAQTVTVTVATTAASSAAPTSLRELPPQFMLLLSMLAMLSGVACRLMLGHKRGLALAAPVLLAITLSPGCGGGSSSTGSNSGTPPGTYTATVTATSGSLSRSTALTVVVQ